MPPGPAFHLSRPLLFISALIILSCLEADGLWAYSGQGRSQDPSSYLRQLEKACPMDMANPGQEEPSQNYKNLSPLGQAGEPLDNGRNGRNGPHDHEILAQPNRAQGHRSPEGPSEGSPDGPSEGSPDGPPQEAQAPNGEADGPGQPLQPLGPKDNIQKKTSDPSGQIRKGLSQAIKDDKIQNSLPMEKKAEGPDLEKFRFPKLPAWDIPQPLIYGLGILAGAIALSLIALITKNILKNRHRRARLKEEDEGHKEKLAQALTKVREEADTLAAEGLYAQAMHALLLKSLSEFTRAKEKAIDPSLTSREILAALSFRPQEREPLKDIVERVEVSWFGNLEPQGSDYAACRQSFQSFLASFSGHSLADGSEAGPYAGQGRGAKDP